MVSEELGIGGKVVEPPLNGRFHLRSEGQIDGLPAGYRRRGTM